MEMTQTIEQLQAIVRELEAENAKLHEQVDLQVPKMAFTQLKEQLAAAQEENKLIMMNLTQCGEQLAKAEQRVAEACALQVATETKLHWLDADRVAKEIRSGEYRKFMKEV